MSDVLEGIVVEQDEELFYISQSEVDSRLSCKRKHWYAFGKTHPKYPETTGLQAVQHSDSLTRGTVGHKFLEEFYAEVKAGKTYQQAFEISRAAHITRMGEHPDRAEIYVEVMNYMTSYVAFYADEEYDPLVLEHTFGWRIFDNVVFPFTPDAIFKHKGSGKIYVVDHKFLYRPYHDRVMPLLPQMLRYSYALMQLGYPVDGYMYNLISTDKRSVNRFKRKVVDFKPVHHRKMKKIILEMVDVMKQIVVDKQKREQWDARATRTMSAFNCTNCPFLELCIAELEDQSGVDLLVGQFYESNKYGYGKEEGSDV